MSSQDHPMRFEMILAHQFVDNLGTDQAIETIHGFNQSMSLVLQS
jgi:hypothetical protein